MKQSSEVVFLLLNEESPISTAVQPNSNLSFLVLKRLKDSFNDPRVNRNKDIDSLVDDGLSNFWSRLKLFDEMVESRRGVETFVFADTFFGYLVEKRKNGSSFVVACILINDFVFRMVDG